MTTKVLVSVKNGSGSYVTVERAAPEAAQPAPPEADLPKTDVSLDDILSRQLLALERVTRQLVIKSSSGNMTKDEIQSLATCIKVTMELKARENELLEDLDEEQLEKLAHD